MEVSSAHLFREFSSLGNEIKELPASYVLQHDGETVVGGFILALVCGILADTDESDQILVFELLHDVEFVLESVKGGGFLLVLFDGN